MNRLVLDRSILAALVLIAGGAALVLGRLSAIEFVGLVTAVVTYFIGMGQGAQAATPAPAPPAAPAPAEVLP